MHTQDWITKGKGCNHSARLCTHIRVIVDFHEIKREEKKGETKSSCPTTRWRRFHKRQLSAEYTNIEQEADIAASRQGGSNNATGVLQSDVRIRNYHFPYT